MALRIPLPNLIFFFFLSCNAVLFRLVKNLLFCCANREQKYKYTSLHCSNDILYNKKGIRRGLSTFIALADYSRSPSFVLQLSPMQHPNGAYAYRQPRRPPPPTPRVRGGSARSSSSSGAYVRELHQQQRQERKRRISFASAGSGGLFGCAADRGACLDTLLCYCCQVSRQFSVIEAAAAAQQQQQQHEGGLDQMYATTAMPMAPQQQQHRHNWLMCCVAASFFEFVPCCLRCRVAEVFGVGGDEKCYVSCLKGGLCCCCSVCETARVLKARGADPGGICVAGEVEAPLAPARMGGVYQRESGHNDHAAKSDFFFSSPFEGYPSSSGKAEGGSEHAHSARAHAYALGDAHHMMGYSSQKAAPYGTAAGVDFGGGYHNGRGRSRSRGREGGPSSAAPLFSTTIRSPSDYYFVATQAHAQQQQYTYGAFADGGDSVVASPPSSPVYGDARHGGGGY